MLGIVVFHAALFSAKLIFQKMLTGIPLDQASNSLNADQALHFVNRWHEQAKSTLLTYQQNFNLLDDILARYMHDHTFTL